MTNWSIVKIMLSRQDVVTSSSNLGKRVLNETGAVYLNILATTF